MESQSPSQPGSLTLASGRVLAWTVFGGGLHPTDAAQPAVIFYFHGFPGAGCEAKYLSSTVLKRHHAVCVAIDRPGMGRSTHDPNRRLLDWPADVLAVAKHLEVDEFYIIAASGGVPYAMACAKEIPFVARAAQSTNQVTPTKDSESLATETVATTANGARLRGVAIVSGAYPITLGFGNMLRGPRILITTAAWMPRFVTGALLDWQIGRVARDRNNPGALEALFDSEMANRPDYELSAYRIGLVRQTAIESARESFRQGSEGVATDLMLICDWGFELQDVNAHGIKMWHGKLDRNVPFSSAEKAAKLLPGAEVHFIENEGHLGLPVRYLDEILANLLAV